MIQLLSADCSHKTEQQMAQQQSMKKVPSSHEECLYIRRDTGRARPNVELIPEFGKVSDVTHQVWPHQGDRLTLRES